MKARVFSPSSSHRDGYRGMDTFPAQNQECLSCARPAPCTQPSLPCSTSMVSMSQGHWMREPRSEYAHMQSTCSRRGAHALSPRSLWCDINANAPLIHLKCRGNCFQYFNELVKDRNRRVHFTPLPLLHLAWNNPQVKVLTLFLLLILHDGAVISRWGET